MSLFGYPLRWPPSKPRTPFPEPAKFYKKNEEGWSKPLSFTDGKTRLVAELERLGADEVQITTNIRFRLDGKRDMNVSRAEPADRGVAIYFELRGQKVELACDKWDKISDNMAAIAAHISALRGQDRWGVGDIRTAFSGHLALPAPMQRKHWTVVLNLPAHASRDSIENAWRGGQREAKSEAEQMDLNIARDEALAEKGFK